jgi:hypothetical protein
MLNTRHHLQAGEIEASQQPSDNTSKTDQAKERFKSWTKVQLELLTVVAGPQAGRGRVKRSDW